MRIYAWLCIYVRKDANGLGMFNIGDHGIIWYALTGRESSTAMSGKKKKILYGGLLIFFWSLIWRGAYHWQTHDTPFMEIFQLDDLWYDSRAMGILEGDWPTEAPYERGPVYPYFLAGVYRVFGHQPNAARLIQHTLGSIMTVLLYLASMKFMRWRWALSAGLAAGIHGAFIMIGGELLIEGFILPLVMLGTYMLLKADGRPGPMRCFIAGLSFGAAACGRPNVLTAIPLIACWLIFNKYSSSSGNNLSIRLKRFLAYGLGLSLLILPVTIRNYVKSGAIVIISSHGGINFYLGNNPHADGHSAHSPISVRTEGQYEDMTLAAAEILAEKETGREMKASEISSFWYGKAFHYIKNNPWDWMKLEFMKLLYSLNAFEITNYRDNVFFAERYSWILKHTLNTTALVLPLSLLGLGAGFRKKWSLGPVYIMIISTEATLLLFFVTARYRLIGMPAAFIFAGLALDSIEDMIRRAEKKKTAVYAIFFLLFFALGISDPGGIRKKYPAGSLNTLAKAYIKKGELEKAEKYLTEALNEDPLLSDPYVNPWVNLGRIRYHLGMTKKALDAYEKALKYSPGDKEAQKEYKITNEEVMNR